MNLTSCLILAMAGHYAACGQIVELLSAKPPENSEELYLNNCVTNWPEKSPTKLTVAALTTHVVLFIDVPFRQAIEDMQTVSGIRIVINTDDLRRAAFDFDCRVSLKVEDAPFCTALRLLLEPLGLDYSITHDAIVIATELQRK